MSLKEIANITGLSISTVSRVLNNPDTACASKEKKEEIMAAVRTIGYTPNLAARNLRKGFKTEEKKTFRFSIIFARIPALDFDAFFYELFQDIEAELVTNNILIDQILFIDDEINSSISFSDGVIILGRCNEPLYRSIRELNKNIVGIWRNPMDFSVDEVICDGKKAAEIAMDYLFTLGHRKIAYIGNCSNESRYNGYCDALIHSGQLLDMNLVEQTNHTADEAVFAIRNLLLKRYCGEIDFTAVFCANDVTAIAVLDELKNEKKKTRQQISIISIDNIAEAQETKPMLTTINIPRKEMSHQAVNILLDRIANKHNHNVRVEFPCEIIIRESCKAVE